MGNQKLSLHDLMPKRGMRYRPGDSILRRGRHDAKIYRAWSNTAGSTKIFDDLSKGSRLVDRVLANMFKLARTPNVSKHLKSSLAGGGFFNFASAVQNETTWAKKLKTGIFMDLLYQLIHAHKMYALEEYGDKNQNDECSLTAKEISAFLAENQRDWQMAVLERENFLLTEAHFRRQQKITLPEHFDDATSKDVTRKATLKVLNAMEMDG
ncbi:hypothetical protein PG990_007430 [Apiospora arundinis]